MKKKHFFIFITLLFYFVLNSCEIREQGNVSATVSNQTACKYKKTQPTESIGISDTLSCVEWKYSASTQKLKLTHKNTVFNCCPGDLYCVVNLLNDTLYLQEHESASSCDCICLFDLNIDIDEIDQKKYEIRFVNETYCSGYPALNFEIDLTQKPEGSHCVTRKGYPYGE